MAISIIMVIIGIIISTLIIIICREHGTTVGGIFCSFIFLLVWLPLCCIPIYVQGYHYETGKGEHTGIVTAVEKNGIFYKTGRAYFKTDIQSSQEDKYCVIDENIYKKLMELSRNKTMITIKYVSHLANGIKNCGIESAVIYEVN